MVRNSSVRFDHEKSVLVRRRLEPGAYNKMLKEWVISVRGELVEPP
jgi:hypothetical protein